MKPKKVIGYKCPSCGDLHPTKEDAWDCCSDADVSFMWECSECGDTYDDKEEAKECCKE